MRPAFVLAGLAMLGGCDRLEMVDAEVRSDHEVAITLPDDLCIDQLEIGTPEIRRTVLWQIERVPGMQGNCPRSVTFPAAPPGFRVAISADRLPRGSYAISGMAGDYAVAGHFDIPKR